MPLRDSLRDSAQTIIERAPLLPRGLTLALGIGAAFGLGIVVAGGIGSARGQTIAPASVDVLAHAQDKSRALEQKRAQLKLTYAAELQKADVVQTETLASAASNKKELAAAAAAAKKGGAPVVAPAVAAAAEGAPLAHGETLVEAPVPLPASAPVVAKPTIAEPDAPPPEKRDDAHLEQALAKVMAAHAVAAPAIDAPVRAPSNASKTYALQVASSPTRAGAEAAAKKLVNARVVEGEVGGKAVFRVRLGAYPDRAAAEKAKASLSQPSFIVAE